MDRDFLIDLFSHFGPVTIRRMFSGFGISADGINFALALRSGLYLRADEQTIARFEAEGSKPFQYQTKARRRSVRLCESVPRDGRLRRRRWLKRSRLLGRSEPP